MEQSTMNIQSILALDLVIIAFAMIPGLKKAFDSLNSYTAPTNRPEHVQERHKELRDIFVALLTDGINAFTDIQYIWPETKYEIKDIVFDNNLWFKAFNIMYKQIIVPFNKNYYDFTFATTNICDFAIKFHDYMYDFAQANKCDFDSAMYKTKFHMVKSWVTSRFQEKINFEHEWRYEYHEFELNDNFLNIVTCLWCESMNEYIQEENDAFDNSNVSFNVELDQKEIMRVSYERRKKNDHAHNKHRC